MKFFYQSGAMGFDGKGYSWHYWMNYRFPKFPTISKTVTFHPKSGHPLWIVPYGDSVWNKVGLHNSGLAHWLNNYYNEDIVLSIAVENAYLCIDAYYSILYSKPLSGIELNMSCPNVSHGGDIYEITDHYIEKMQDLKSKGHIGSLYLKVGACHNLNYFYKLPYVDRIHINSVPKKIGAVSGNAAKKANWAFIERWQGRHGIPEIAGASWSSLEDIKSLKGMGCKTIGIGSAILTNPCLVERLTEYEE